MRMAEHKKSVPGKLNHLNDPDAVEKTLQEIADGKYVAEVAKELDVSKVALRAKLVNHPDYPKALEVCMENKLEKAMQDIEAAGDDLNLARVREIVARRLEWRAERMFPHRWGQKNHVTVEHTGDLGDRLRRARERTIEGVVVSKDVTNAEEQQEE